MDYGISGLDFIPLEGWEVPASDWAFAHHLNQLHRQWVFLRRVLRIVRCLNPATGELDTLFDELVWGEGHDEAAHRWADSIWQSFSCDETQLQTSLARCVATMSEEAMKSRVDLWADDIDPDDANHLLSLAKHFANLRKDASWQHGFFYEAAIAASVVGRWEERFNQLKGGEYLRQWKHGAVLRGASAGGKAGARGRQVVSPAHVWEQLDRLIQGGIGARDAPAIAAKRLGISADHVRRLRRQRPSDKSNEPTKPT